MPYPDKIYHSAVLILENQWLYNFAGSKSRWSIGRLMIKGREKEGKKWEEVYIVGNIQIANSWCSGLFIIK